MLRFGPALTELDVRCEFDDGSVAVVHLERRGAEATTPPGGWSWYGTVNPTYRYDGETRLLARMVDHAGEEVPLDSKLASRVAEQVNRADSVARGQAPITTYWTSHPTREPTIDDAQAALDASGWYQEKILDALAAGRTDEAESWRKHWANSWLGRSGGTGPGVSTSGKGVTVSWPDGHVTNVPWALIMRRARERAAGGTLF